MEITRNPCYYGKNKMPYARSVVVKGAKDWVFLSGVAGITVDKKTGKTYIPQGAEAQAKAAMEKMKERLEEAGSNLNNVVRMVFYIVQPEGFPDGVANSPTWISVKKALNEFFQEHCPDLCWERNPANLDLIGVVALGRKDFLLEIAATAVIPG